MRRECLRWWVPGGAGDDRAFVRVQSAPDPPRFATAQGEHPALRLDRASGAHRTAVFGLAGCGVDPFQVEPSATRRVTRPDSRSDRDPGVSVTGVPRLRERGRSRGGHRRAPGMFRQARTGLGPVSAHTRPPRQSRSRAPRQIDLIMPALPAGVSRSTRIGRSSNATGTARCPYSIALPRSASSSDSSMPSGTAPHSAFGLSTTDYMASDRSWMRNEVLLVSRGTGTKANLSKTVARLAGGR